MQNISPRILCIEDNEDNRFLLNTLLRFHGYEVTTADSVTSGLALTEQVHDEPQAALMVANEDRFKNDRRR